MCIKCCYVMQILTCLPWFLVDINRIVVISFQHILCIVYCTNVVFDKVLLILVTFWVVSMFNFANSRLDREFEVNFCIRLCYRDSQYMLLHKVGKVVQIHLLLSCAVLRRPIGWDLVSSAKCSWCRPPESLACVSFHNVGRYLKLSSCPSVIIWQAAQLVVSTTVTFCCLHVDEWVPVSSGRSRPVCEIMGSSTTQQLTTEANC